MRLIVQGHGPITLGKADFVAAGGEGRIYAKGRRAVKIYNDPAQALPEAKLRELSAIAHKRVVGPERLVLDPSGTIVGYDMPLVQNTWSLCQLFPPAFQRRHGVHTLKRLELVRQLADVVRSVHASRVLIVDLNELNVLVDHDFSGLHLIDVDSWQTPRFPATAIMTSVRDPHSPAFWTGSDWYSYAVVCFQLLIGMHPFKGKHPQIKGIEERMRANVSVFDSDVRMPRVVPPLSTLPPHLSDWMRGVFQDGDRCPPPPKPGALPAAALPTPVTLPSKHVQLTAMLTLPSALRDAWCMGDTWVSWCDDGVYVGTQRVLGPREGVVGVVWTETGVPVLAQRLGLRLLLTGLNGRAVAGLGLLVHDAARVGNRLVIRCGEHVLDVIVGEVGNSLLATTQALGQCLAHASKLFEGVLVQDVLGDTWCTLTARRGSALTLRVPELDNYSVVDARFEEGVLMALCTRGTVWSRHMLRFARDLNSRDHTVMDGVGPSSLHSVVLPRGVVVWLDDELHLHPAQPGTTAQRSVRAPDGLPGDMMVAHQGDDVLVLHGSTLSRMTLT